MLFSSIPFLFYFLPMVIAVYFLVPYSWRNAVLLVFSLLFYAWGEPRYVILMMFTILLFYICGIAIEKSASQKYKRIWLTASIVISVALLGIFKYADFFISSFNSVAGTDLPFLKLALPIGISFYTFQCLSYTVDIYRGTVAAQKNLISFGAYVALFPQLIAGPIVRYVDVAQQLEHRNHSFDQALLGARRFLIGLSKKILLANQFGQLTEIFRMSAEKSVVFYWLYAVGFMLQIYFDFSGYSDMAIGLGRIFGFRFPENFDYPYLSRSITEFWRRWHITLGGWFRDYVYIPLGGSRVSKGRWMINILLVWMLTGLWHGAAWNFVLWGLLYALFLLLEKWTSGVSKLPAVLRHSYVLLIVLLGFVLFNAADLGQAAEDIGGLFGFRDIPLLSAETVYYLRSYGVLLVLGILGATPVVRNAAVRIGNGPFGAVAETGVLIALLVLCCAFLVDGSFNPFLYFRF